MTDQTDRSETKGKDLLGLFLSGIGGLFFVSILLSFGDRTPKDVIWTAPVLGLIESIGRIPAMILTGGVAGLGTALFLGRGEFEVGRHLLGLAGLGLALVQRGEDHRQLVVFTDQPALAEITVPCEVAAQLLQARFGLLQFQSQAVAIQTRQHLPLAHGVAFLDQQFNDFTADFGRSAVTGRHQQDWQ